MHQNAGCHATALNAQSLVSSMTRSKVCCVVCNRLNLFSRTQLMIYQTPMKMQIGCSGNKTLSPAHLVLMMQPPQPSFVLDVTHLGIMGKLHIHHQAPDCLLRSSSLRLNIQNASQASFSHLSFCYWRGQCIVTKYLSAM